MTGPGSGSGEWGPYDRRSASGGSGADPYEPFEAPERSGLARGVLIVVVAVILGALLLPSATRAPLAFVATRSTTTAPISSTTTEPISHSTTANAGHGSAPTTPVGHGSSTTTTGPRPATIHVLVANATSVNGIAGVVTAFLGTKGFATLTAANATTRLTMTAVYYTSAGSIPDANEVAGVLGLGPATIQAASATPPVASTAGATVIVIAGSDLASRFGPSSTSTTAMTATTTAPATTTTAHSH